MSLIMIPTPPFQSAVSSPRNGGMQPEAGVHSSQPLSLVAPNSTSMPVVLPASHPLAARGFDESAAPSSPRVSTSHARVTLAGKDTSLADRPAIFLSDDPWLAATRESQGQPIDAIPRTGDWPYTVNREGEIIDMRDGEIACELMAQIGLGIKRV